MNSLAVNFTLKLKFIVNKHLSIILEYWLHTIYRMSNSKLPKTQNFVFSKYIHNA